METVPRIKKGLCISSFMAVVSVLMPPELYAETHYVDINSAAPVAPYTNWTTAATNIQQAVDVSISGDTVLITNGTYLLSAQISVTNDITIQSINGPDFTVVDGGGSNRCFSLGSTLSVLSGLTITNGFTADDGGGVYCTSTNPIVTSCMITGNSGDSGGGMYSGTAKSCWFIGNSADFGGGIYNGTADNCVIKGNSANAGGGMCYVSANKSTIIGNSAWNGGGMIWGIANNCKIIGNSALSEGGGMMRGIANNCTIMENAAADGGGVYHGTVNNCSIFGNSALSDGGGLCYGTANNCIIWHNESENGENLYHSSATACSSPDVQHGVDGNITNAPLMLFASHIATNSPCRAAGNPAFSSGTDIDGQVWLNPPSIGCDEPYGEGSFTGPITLTLSNPTDLFSTGYPVEFLALVQGSITETRVTFGDGKTTTNALYYFDHIWETEGDYDVIFTAFNDSYPAGVSATQTVHVISAEASSVYVSGVAGNDAADGLSWATAKRTIQAGVNAQSLFGGRILISNGTYVVTSEISVDKPIRLYGLNGPDHTIIDGGGSNRCFNLGNSACLLSGLTITNGFTTGDGGGVYCSGFIPVITNCVISGNSAVGRGGGLGHGTAVNCMINGNSAESGGGMAFGTADNCLIKENTATFGGGGIYYVAANHCTIIGNSADSGGGVSGFQFQASGEFEGIINNCVISGNSAEDGGGVASCTANNCVISGNSATSFGGGMSYGAANNCTISGNSASRWGGGTAWVTVNNCIVWYNAANRYPNLSESSASYCFSPDVRHGVDGNSTIAPMLLSASHIATNSPCRGAGNPDFISGTDIDGQAWLNPPSIGCDEPAGPGTYTGPIELALSGPDTLFSAGHSVVFTAIIHGAINETRIAFGDGTIATNSPYIFKHTWAAGGDYEVVLTAFNDSYPDGIPTTQTVHVVSEEASTIYVSRTTGNDVADGLSWATAKQTIQAGVDAQNVVGARVVISNGTYIVDAEIRVEKEIRLVGLNGPDHTIVDGGGSNRCFNLGNSPCLLSGLTITNGFTTGDGGGIYCSGMIPEVLNCVISGNSAGNGGGIYYGTANHCTISGNSAASGGGGMRSGTANHCTISWNSAKKGGGIYSGAANNCTISGNAATDDYGAAGMHYGSAVNCIIWHNESRRDLDLVATDSSYCSSPNLVHGRYGNSTNAPLFLNLETGDLHLQANSPCINWGDNAYVNSAVDLDGNPRVVGAHVDMGAYEYQTDLGADGDHDGMPDDWERTFFGYNVLPLENADNDAHSNVDEYITGTDPTNSTSYFTVTGSIAENNGTNAFVVEWISVPDRVYSVEWTTNLVIGFQTLETNIEHPQNYYIDTTHNAETNGYYQVEARLK